MFKTEPTERCCHGDGCYEKGAQISCWRDGAEAGPTLWSQRPSPVHPLFKSCLLSPAWGTHGWLAAATPNMPGPCLWWGSTNLKHSSACVHMCVCLSTNTSWAALLSSLTDHIPPKYQVWACARLKGDAFFPPAYLCRGSSYVSWPQLTSTM